MTMERESEQRGSFSSRYARFFGLEGATPDAARLVKILSAMLSSFAASFQISTTFWMIFIAESLGHGDYYAGLTLVGVLVVIQMAVQTLLDYPTGVIGDWIGQRYVIASALLCYAAAFWLSAQIVNDTPAPFYVYVMIYFLFGLGASQESGAFNAWFDNNYRLAMPHDRDRKMYGVFWGRMSMVWSVSSTLVLLPGSWLAWYYGEQWVFNLQAVFSVVLATAAFRLIRDLPGVKKERVTRPVMREYGGLLKEGFKFLWSSRFVTYLVLGGVVLGSTGPVWWNLILFPLYFSYLVTAVAVSAFRTLIYLPQALSNERSGVIAKRYEPTKWIPRFRYLQFTGVAFYILLAVIIYLFPNADPNTTEFVGIFIPFTNLPLIEIPVQTLVPVVLIFIVFVASNLFGTTADILTQRVMLDVVPNRIRNAMYSLQPTLVMITSMPLIAFFGWLIPQSGGLPLTLTLCAVISLVGTVMIYTAFKHPIPVAEIVVETDKKKKIEVESLDVT
jgi:MFS family permease